MLDSSASATTTLHRAPTAARSASLEQPAATSRRLWCQQQRPARAVAPSATPTPPTAPRHDSATVARTPLPAGCYAAGENDHGSHSSATATATTHRATTVPQWATKPRHGHEQRVRTQITRRAPTASRSATAVSRRATTARDWLQVRRLRHQQHLDRLLTWPMPVIPLPSAIAAALTPIPPPSVTSERVWRPKHGGRLQEQRTFFSLCLRLTMHRARPAVRSVANKAAVRSAVRSATTIMAMIRGATRRRELTPSWVKTPRSISQ